MFWSMWGGLRAVISRQHRRRVRSTTLTFGGEHWDGDLLGTPVQTSHSALIIVSAFTNITMHGSKHSN